MDEIKDNKLDDVNAFKGKWYVINCYSGHEDKVKEDLEQRIKSLNKSDIIFDIRVVKEQVQSKKTKKMIEKNLYPGYIFINMIMDDEAWYIVRNTTGVTGFIGSSGKGTKPFPLTEQEAKSMLERTENKKTLTVSKKPKKVVKVNFDIDDYVEILIDPFAGKEGQVIGMDRDKGIATINVEIFGRYTPTQIPFDGCKKLSADD